MLSKEDFPFLQSSFRSCYNLESLSQLQKDCCIVYNNLRALIHLARWRALDYNISREDSIKVKDVLIGYTVPIVLCTYLAPTAFIEYDNKKLYEKVYTFYNRLDKDESTALTPTYASLVTSKHGLLRLDNLLNLGYVCAEEKLLTAIKTNQTPRFYVDSFRENSIISNGSLKRNWFEEKRSPIRKQSDE